MDAAPQPPPEPTPSATAQGIGKPILPYSRWWPVAAGVMTGIALRLVFSGRPGSPYTAMMSSFILLVPLLVGAATVYVAETQRRRSWAYYAWAPVLANVLFVLGTMAMMIEGLICAILIVPLRAMSSSLSAKARLVVNKRASIEPARRIMTTSSRKSHKPRTELSFVASHLESKFVSLKSFAFHDHGVDRKSELDVLALILSIAIPKSPSSIDKKNHRMKSGN